MYELIDIRRQQNPKEENFTWRYKSFKIQCRLDYFLISRQLTNLTNKCTFVFAPETDPSAIFIHLQSAELKQQKSPEFWKCNQSLMHDETYVSLLRAEIENFKQKYIDCEDLNLRWDLIKMEIRGFTVKHSKIKSKERKSTKTILLSRINDLFKIAEAELNNKHISCVYKFYSCVNLKIVFQSTRCIKSFFPYKDRINHSQQSRVIYRANCWHCNAFYIG